jgi:phage tail P2-like protein
MVDISFADLLPESIKNDPVIKDAAAVLDGELKAVAGLMPQVEIYSRIDGLDEDVVDLLAWQFNVDFWNMDLPVANKRELIKNSIGWHKKKGTPWAITEALRKSGYYAEIITYQDAQNAVKIAGGSKLDGKWKLDGSRSLVPFSRVSGAAYMEHWAQFCVKFDILSSERSGWEAEARNIVNEAKNARSHPVWLYFLRLTAGLETTTTSRGMVCKKTQARPLKCSTCLDGTWSLGWDEECLCLDGSWGLAGELKLGQVLRPAMPERTITDCRLATRAGGGNRATVHVGYPADTSNVPYFTLSNLTRKLDGMWGLGADNRLDGTWELTPGARLSSPCLGDYPAYQLGEGLKLGYKEPESGSWPQISGGIYGDSNID